MAKNTPIRHFRSSSSGTVPAYTSLEYGELGINYADGALFYRNSSDAVIPVATVNNNLVAGEYLFATSTSATDPGSGVVRFNNGTRNSVTAIYIDQLSNLKTDGDLIFKSLVAGDVIVWQDKATAANTVRYRVTTAPTNNTGWWSIPVEWMSETGSLWTANTLLSFTIYRIGTIGTNGLVNDAVTYAKLQNVSAQKVLGRVTNSSGDAEEISTTGWSATAKVVMDQSPTLVTPNIGTPSAGTLTNCTGLPTAGLVNGAVTLAKMDNMATSSLIYRKTAGSGAPEVNTLATLKTDLGLTGTNSGDQTISLTGDVTGSGTGSFAATIANDAVTFGKMQNSAAAGLSVVGRSTNSAGDFAEIAAAASGQTLRRNGTALQFDTVNSLYYPTWLQSSQTGPSTTTGVAIYATSGLYENNTGTATLPAGIHYYKMKFRLARTAGTATGAKLQFRLDASSSTTGIFEYVWYGTTYTITTSSNETASATTLDTNIMLYGTDMSTWTDISTSIADASMLYDVTIEGFITLTSARTMKPEIRFHTGSGYTTTISWGSFWKIDSTPYTSPSSYGLIS